MVIYKITNKIDGKQYIGQTVQNIAKRWTQHRSDALIRKNHTALHRAMNKYGTENFSIKVLAHCNSMEEMNHRESYYIKLFNTLAPNGYNIALGGKNQRHSEETKKRLSNLKIGVKTGKTWNKGISPSPETIAKIAASSRGENNGMYGRKHSLEAKDKIRKSRIGKFDPKVIAKLAKINRKPIICVNSGKTYESTVAASLDLGLNPKSINMVLKGKRKTHKGFSFYYIDNSKD